MSSQDFASCDEENVIGLDSAHMGREKLENCVSLPQPLKLDEDEIFAAATDYQNWSYSRYTLKDLPPFDNTALFGLTVEDENANIREEIRKLVQFIASQQPPLFDTDGALGNTNAAGFADLYSVVDQILCNIRIIRHDNACLAFDHYVHEKFYEAFHHSRQLLRTRYLGKSGKIIGNNPRILSDEKKNMQAYHGLIDFIFQSLAWWLVHAAERKSWHAPIIAVLSRWSVKLKLIALDPVRWAEMALVRGEDVMRRISNEQSSDSRMTIEFPSNGPQAERKTIHFPEDRDLDYFYYLWNYQFREDLHDFVNSILQNLIAERSNTRSAAFEVRTLIYTGGLDEKLRHLTVQRDGTVETSSNPADLGRSYRALQLLLSNAQRIAHAKLDVELSETAKIHWYIKHATGSDANIGTVTTARLDDVVSALVPLGLIGASHLVKTLDNPLTRGNLEAKSPPLMIELSPEDYPRIEFSLSTRQNKNNELRRADPKMIPSSKSPLIASMHDIDKELDDFDTRNIISSEITLKRNALRVLRDYNTRKSEIQSWTITEDSVRVRTSKYSGIVLTIALLIIGGCLAIPFVVGERIPGVDPFQFVTFGWLLAGAFLVGAKSRYVESWPWHDFLRGQVVCRSVSELAVASRVKKQAVLLYLLHHEFRNPLVFRGPYHGVFRRQVKSRTEGFSIDVPTGHATVLVAGFIVLEVFETQNETRKVYTVLQDTREDVPESMTEQALLFEPYEVLGDEGEKRKLQYKRKDQLERDEYPATVLSRCEVVGLPTAPYNFI